MAAFGPSLSLLWLPTIVLPIRVGAKPDEQRHPGRFFAFAVRGPIDEVSEGRVPPMHCYPTPLPSLQINDTPEITAACGALSGSLRKQQQTAQSAKRNKSTKDFEEEEEEWRNCSTTFPFRGGDILLDVVTARLREAVGTDDVLASTVHGWTPR